MNMYFTYKDDVTFLTHTYFPSSPGVWVPQGQEPQVNILYNCLQAVELH